MNVCEILAKSAEMWPEKTAVIDRYGAVTYSSMYREMESMSRKLRELGVEPGHGIGIMARNGREFIITAFASLQTGAVILPIHYQIRRSELNELLETCSIHAVIDDMSGIKPVDGPSSDLQIEGADPLRFTRTDTGCSAGPCERKPITETFEDAAFVRFTSGTTGRSKGVVVSHRGIIERTAAANRGFALSHEDVVLCVLPMAFHFLVSTVLYLEAGATIIICPDLLAHSIINQANQHSATFLYGSPMHYRLLTSDASDLGFRTIRQAVSTSSSLPSDISLNFYDKYGVPVNQAYGIIECGIPLMNLKNPLEKPASVGRPLPGYEVSILDDRLQEVQNGAVGQLAFRGPGLFSGYLKPPGHARNILREGWFLSGDQALKDDDGDVTIAGRTKSMINVAGNKVFPEEVEAVVNRHPDVQVSRAYSSPHLYLGEVVHVDIVVKDPSAEIDTEGLVRFCREHLTSYKVPQSITVVREINETLSGKISRAGV
ncbi:MAG: AMP-binding protein [Nitrospirae bacterium]|nr:AMP-binding protein [Nitrospirota bacterium]